MRKVKIKHWDRDAKEWLETEGVFHEWGCFYEEFESGPGNYSMALVEVADGSIKEVLPCDIHFMETDALEIMKRRYKPTEAELEEAREEDAWERNDTLDLRRTPPR